MKFKEKMQLMPSVEHPVAYLVVVLLFLLMLKTPILAGFPNPELILVMYLGVFLLFSVTIGFKEFKPFYNKGGNFLNLIALTGAVYFWGILVESLVGNFLSANDPQQLDTLVYHFSWPFVINEAARYMLVGIGEEIFKMCVFLLLYYLLVKGTKNRLISCGISVLVTSFIFGILHSNYNYDQWLNITLIIGSGAVVYFYFLIKYRTIVPLMIAHGLQDFLVTLEHTQGFEGIYINFLTGVLLLWFILRFGFRVKLQSNTKSIKAPR